MNFARKALSFAALLTFAGFAFAAETPFAGTWKANLDKSKMTGDTVKFTAAGESMRVTSNGDSYEFKPDGSDAKTSFGSASWKKIDDTTWEEIDKVKDTVQSKTSWTLSNEGKTLTAHITGDKPAGGSFDETVVYVRTVGTKGLAGTWKDKQFKRSTPPSVLIISQTDDGLALDQPDFKLKASGKFDGKQGSVEGPTIPPGASFTLTRASSHSFKMVRTQNGKAFDMSTWTVSPDGKSLNVVTRTAGTTDPPTTEVFDKQ